VDVLFICDVYYCASDVPLVPFDSFLISDCRTSKRPRLRFSQVLTFLHFTYSFDTEPCQFFSTLQSVVVPSAITSNSPIVSDHDTPILPSSPTRLYIPHPNASANLTRSIFVVSHHTIL
jgi:hypothetical protein